MSKQFKCGNCSARFSERSRLSRHIKNPPKKCLAVQQGKQSAGSDDVSQAEEGNGIDDMDDMDDMDDRTTWTTWTFPQVASPLVVFHRLPVAFLHPPEVQHHQTHWRPCRHFINSASK